MEIKTAKKKQRTERIMGSLEHFLDPQQMHMVVVIWKESAADNVVLLQG